MRPRHEPKPDWSQYEKLVLDKLEKLENAGADREARIRRLEWYLVILIVVIVKEAWPNLKLLKFW